MFEIQVFSNPLNSLAGEGGFLHYTHLGRTAAYDEDLVKPALLLADRVTLRSHRIDLILNEERDISTSQKLIPLYRRFINASKERDPKLISLLGISASDLLTPDEIERYEANSDADVALTEDIKSRAMPTNRDAYRAEKDRQRMERAATSAVWDEFWDRAEPFRTSLAKHFGLMRDALASGPLSQLEESGILSQQPWDETPRSRPREIIDGLLGPNTEFERAYWSMVDEVANSDASVMLDNEVHASIGKLGPEIGGLESGVTVGGAVDLMRMVEGIAVLPLDEVRDVRAELEPYIQPFRTFLLEVSSGADLAGAGDAERARLLKLAWERNVAPAISDMRQHVESASFVQNAIDVFANSGETMRTVGMAVGIAAAAGFTGLSTFSAAAAVAPPLLKAFLGSVRARQDSVRHRAYFVHALETSKWGRR